MFVFNNTEERWFLRWVVIRRKFRISQENVRELIKEVNYWRSKSYDLEIQNKDLLKKMRGQGASQQEIDSAEERRLMIEDFNRKNNKGRNYRKKRKKRNKR